MATHNVCACFLLIIACVSVSGKKEDTLDFQLDKHDNLVDTVPNNQDIYELSNEGFEYFNDGWNELNGIGENNTTAFNEALKFVKLYEKTTPTPRPLITATSPDSVSTFTLTLRPSPKKIIPLLVTWKFKQHPANISTIREPPRRSAVRTVSTVTSKTVTTSVTIQKQTTATTTTHKPPIRANTIPPLKPPIRSNTISPLKPPIRANTISPLKPPIRANTISPLKTPIRANTISPLKPPIRANTIPPLKPVNKTIHAPTQKPVENSTVATSTATSNVATKRKQISGVKTALNKGTKRPTLTRTPQTKRTPTVTAKISPKTTKAAVEHVTATTVVPNRKKIPTRKTGLKKSTKRLTTTDVPITKTITKSIVIPIITQTPPGPTPSAIFMAKTKQTSKRKTRLNKDLRKRFSVSRSTRVPNSNQHKTTTPRSTVMTTNTMPTRRPPQAKKVWRRRRPLSEKKLKQNNRAKMPSYGASTTMIPFHISSQLSTYAQDHKAAIKHMSSHSSPSIERWDRKPRLTRKKVITMEDWVFSSSNELDFSVL